MAVHGHPVNDMDSHFIIDPITRAVVNAESKKTMLMQNDHNSERFTFEIDARVEDHDLTQCNSVEVHYINTDQNKKNSSIGVYEVKDVEKSEDGSKITFSWVVSENATLYPGSLNFLIRFACIENGVNTYRWNTAINNSISIAKGMYNGEVIEELYPDILNQWKEELFAAVYGYKIISVGRTEPEVYPYIWFDTSEANVAGVGTITVKDINGNKQQIYPEVKMESVITLVTELREDLTKHINDSIANHTHTPESIGAAPAEHTHTPEQVGAAPASHTHTPDEAGAAPSEHTHDISEVTDLPNILDNKAVKSVGVTATLSATSWEGNIQTVTVEGVTATSNVIFDIGMTATTDEFEAAIESMLKATAQGDGTVTITAFGDVPAIDIPVQFIIMG